jgi:F-type H+-transporting ATPase subunit b
MAQTLETHEVEHVAAGDHVETTDQGVLATLGINGGLFLFQLLNFAIVVAILWFLILKPLTSKMSERQQKIDKSLTNAEKVQENLERSEQKYQERVDQAKVDANKVVEKATKEANVLGVELKEKAKKEIEELVERAKTKIKEERGIMIKELTDKNAELIALALEKILAEKVDTDKDKELIEDMLKKVKLS